jgi:parallel beta-helix repeat protein
MRHPLSATDRFIPRILARRLPCPDGPPARTRRQNTVALFAAVLLMALAAPDASAALSRWSASNNRIYVYNGGTMTLTEIRATTPNLPDTALQRVGDAANKVWLLTANIIVEGDTLLNLTGDVKELRLQSNPSADYTTDVTNFISITAGNFDVGSTTAGLGKIMVNGVKVTSWDTTANGPDTNTADGRAFMRARSALLGSAPAQSRMDILSSDVSYLGYEHSESYGLSWKVNGDLGAIDVFGNIKNSKIHHNHYGVYSFGLKGAPATASDPGSGQWTGNEVYSNDGYGFDAHDHSDDLVIDSNNVHDNGKVDKKGRHGIILSESCLRAQITNNTSNANGGIDVDPVTGEPKPEGAGIMLHNFSDDGIVEGNTTSNNVDSGIAVFCSVRAQVRGNTVAGNGQYGIRLTVAAKNNTVDDNQISGSGKNGILVQPASDSNNVCGTLTPRDNTFTGNTVGTSVEAAVKVTDATANTFVGNTFNDSGVSIRNSTSTSEQTVDFRENTFGSGVVLSLDGATDRPLRANISKSARVSMELDIGSLARFTDDAGAIFDLARDLLVQVTGSNSSIDLTSGSAGAAFVVDTRPLFVTTDGSLVEVAPTQWDTSGDLNKGWIARAANGSGTVQYAVGDLQRGVAYDVTRDSTAVGTFVANTAGRISFSDAPGTTSTVTYALTRSPNQPRSGEADAGGSSGALDFAMLTVLALAGLARRRPARLLVAGLRGAK